jgi:two-component system, NarL family, captular synthesis response regulator RcsB
MRINIAVADSHPAVLVGVERVLSKFEQFNITGTARNASELEALLATKHCDVLVTDYLAAAHSRRDKLAFLGNIQRLYPALQIVLFTIGNHPAVERAALNIGIRSIVRKTDEEEMLVEAVRAASHQIPARVLAPMDCGHTHTAHPASANDQTISQAVSPFSSLTPREFEVLRLYASGLTVTQIAQHLNQARQTVSAQKLSAMRKCGVARDVDLFRLVYENPLSLRLDDPHSAGLTPAG